MLEVLTILDNTRSLHAWIQDLMPGGSLQVRDGTAFSRHFFIVHHIKITIHLSYCDPKLVYHKNTKRNYTVQDCVVFS